MENLTPLNITRIKNVTNKKSGRAYLNFHQVDFILHWPDRKRGNILDVNESEIIVLYQKINGTKYLTHLVIPVDRLELDEGKRENYRYGRKVRILANTGEDDAIRFDNTKLIKLNFLNRGWGSAELLTSIAKNKKIEEYQIDLWNKFSKYFNADLDRSNKLYSTYDEDIDESNVGKVAKEGKLKLINHYVRERNRKLVKQRKQLAIQNNTFFCEVCNFSFEKVYKQEFIECHHIIPIAEGARETKLEDLGLVCSNCHRMLHRIIDGKYFTIDELKIFIDKIVNS